MKRWKFAAASAIGTSHLATGGRKQDSYACSEVVLSGEIEPALIAIVSDGAGSAEKGGEAASVVCRTFKCLAQKHLQSHCALPDSATIDSWIGDIRDRLHAAAANRDLPVRQFAATLVAVIATGDEVIISHIGDGAVVGKGHRSNVWDILSWPENGEYASTTFFVTDPKPRIRISRLERQYEAIALCTDGVERLGLDFSTRVASPGFYDAMLRPVAAAEGDGLLGDISSKLQSYLESDKVNTMTDDDKTLIVAVLQ